MNKKYRIGCSGYYYPAWKNKFYPEGLKPKDWLKHYSTIFNTVELNGTFYRVPKLSDLKKYTEITSDDFTFSVKMNKTITHFKKLKDCKQLIEEFQNLIEEGLEEKLGYFLFQMPPSFHYNEENLERVLNYLPKKTENILEVRHASWWEGDAEKILKKHKVSLCNVDFPGLNSHFTKTSSEFYLRLHGNPELFKSSYSSEKLQEFSKKIPDKCKHYSIYFNNTYYEAGYKNAIELINIVTGKNA